MYYQGGSIRAVEDNKYFEAPKSEWAKLIWRPMKSGLDSLRK